ncbi:MAG: PqqD family protein [Candidatus Promineifilaceae bacterium]
MDANSVLRRSANTSYERVADEAILIRLDTGAYFSLNKVGTDFWELLDGATSIAGHAQTIAEKYQVEPDRVGRDLLELAGKLAADRLVEIS